VEEGMVEVEVMGSSPRMAARPASRTPLGTNLASAG
jgi:hypothetical protein